MRFVSQTQESDGRCSRARFGVKGNQMVNGQVIPAEILEVGRDNATVAACIQLWKNGDCTWGQAMMRAVMELSDANARFYQELLKAANHRPVVVRLGGEPLTE